MSKHGSCSHNQEVSQEVLVGATTIEVDSGDQWSHYCIPEDPVPVQHLHDLAFSVSHSYLWLRMTDYSSPIQ
jgi:hypothetical protein